MATWFRCLSSLCGFYFAVEQPRFNVERCPECGKNGIGQRAYGPWRQ